MTEERKFQYRKWQYYAIIGVVSMIAVFFLPMIGSEAGLAWKLPNTVVGWVVYVISKLLIAAINMLLFYCFMEQAKVNVQDNARYIEANQILIETTGDKDLLPRSPKEWNSKEYGTKGITVFVTSMLSAIGLTQAILSFDWVSMLTYLFTIVMGVIFGVIQMNKAEEYWTNEYWKYAKMVQKQVELAKEEHTEQRDDSTNSDSRDDILDACVDTSDTSSDDKPVVVDSSDCSDSILGGSIHTSDITTTRFYRPDSQVVQEN